MDVTVCVGTFGSASWIDLARERAIPSIPWNVPHLHEHRSTLHEARNACLEQVDTEWVCYLDADDELEEGYFEAMAGGVADLRAPSVRYVKNRHIPHQRMPRVAGHGHHCTAECLPYGNWLVIGTVARTELLREVGGWRDFEWSEDWDLWARCWLAGATIEAIPTATYRAHVRADSRNRGLEPERRLAAHRAIAEANGLPVP